jgi:hypothetical protein
MTVTVPTSGGKKDMELATIQAKITNYASLISANASPLLLASYVAGKALAEQELVAGLVAHGKLQASTILSVCTYGT